MQPQPIKVLLLTPLFGTAEVWRHAFAVAMPELEVRIWPDVGNPSDIDAAAIGLLPAGELRKLPNLRLIVSLFAGADALLRDSNLPSVPIARAGNPAGDTMMNETVLLHVLRHHRNLPAFQQAQQRCEWIKLPILRTNERSVGVMGLGFIGLAAAKTLAAQGFKVAGWVRQKRSDAGIEIFAGSDRFNEFLARSEILVNLLPLTPETSGLINAETLRQLPKGAAVINLGRGDHVVETDLIAALDSGHLDSATLDVFSTEPLPSNSPLWRHPKITITPHAARRLDPGDMVPRICESIEKVRKGIPLTQLIDPNRGY